MRSIKILNNPYRRRCRDVVLTDINNTALEPKVVNKDIRRFRKKHKFYDVGDLKRFIFAISTSLIMFILIEIL